MSFMSFMYAQLSFKIKKLYKIKQPHYGIEVNYLSRHIILQGNVTMYINALGHRYPIVPFCMCVLYQRLFTKYLTLFTFGPIVSWQF